MTHRNLLLCLFAGFPAALGLTASVAQADTITWASVQDATSPLDVSTDGNLVTARNCWAQTFSAPTVNGVAFAAYAPIGWTNGGWTLNNGSSSGDSSYDAMLDSARVTSFGNASNPTDWGAIRLDTLGTLTVGTQYEIQVWYSDQRPGNGSNFLNDRTMLLSSAVGAATVSGGVITNLGSVTQGPTSAPLDADPNNTFGAGDTVLGQFATGTFTRTSTDPLYLLVQGVHPMSGVNLRPHVNAFQIREATGGSSSMPFCDSNPLNSAGQRTTMSQHLNTGIESGLRLEVSAGVPGEFGYFLVSAGFSDPGTTISNGQFCLLDGVNPFGRYNFGSVTSSIGAFDLAGDFQNLVGTATSNGGYGYDVPTILPGAVGGTIQSGSTWHFQFWHRDTPAGVGVSTFSNGLSVTFP